MCCALRVNNSGMDRSAVRQSVLFGEHSCPVECITKVLVFIVITVIILYLPLGDLNGLCEHTTCGRKTTAYLATSHSNDNHVAVCCLCDTYKILLKAGRVILRAIELLAYVLLDLLYEAKLKFYALLESLDRHDLCRSVCCKDDEVNQNAVTEKRANCRCKSKNCKHKT